MDEPRPDRNIGFLVHDVARLLRTAYDRRTRDLGLTRSQWWVLNHLYFHEGITQSALADLLDIEKPSLGRLLDRLEAKGWLERRPDPGGDRRVRRVYLTGEVQSLMRSLRGLAAELRSDALQGLSESECQRFLDLLLVVKANLLRMNGNGPADGVEVSGRATGSPTAQSSSTAPPAQSRPALAPAQSSPPSAPAESNDGRARIARL